MLEVVELPILIQDRWFSFNDNNFYKLYIFIFHIVFRLVLQANIGWQIYPILMKIIGCEIVSDWTQFFGKIKFVEKILENVYYDFKKNFIKIWHKLDKI